MSSVTGQAHGSDALGVGDVGAAEHGDDAGLRAGGGGVDAVIRACAYGLRRMARCSMPGSTMLSVQRVRPVIRRASSLRRRGAPTSAGAVVGDGHAATSSSAVTPVRPAPECASRPRRPGRRGRCSGSRCTGTGCPRCPRGSRPRVGSGSPASRSTAAMIMPGVQKPHCSACCSWNACCTGCSAPSARRGPRSWSPPRRRPARRAPSSS